MSEATAHREPERIPDHDQLAVLDVMEAEIERAQPPLQKLEHRLAPFVSLVVLPVFALANAGVRLDPGAATVADPVLVGVLLGLFVGKPLGIVGLSWLAVRVKLAQLPEGATWAQVRAVSVLAGLGPTLRQLATEEAASLVIDVEPGLVLSADPVTVASIVDNLGRNALLYLGSSARREVGIVARAGGDQVMIDVVDSGPGIPPDLQKRLFKPFERGSERPGGSGLGLATVKRLVDAHGGTLEVSSRLGVGTTFRVRLRGAPTTTTRPAADASMSVHRADRASSRLS